MTKKSNKQGLSSHLSPIILLASITVAIIIAIILLTALLSFNPADPAWSRNDSNVITNSMGLIGAWYSDISFSFIGKLSYLIPISIIALCLQAWFSKDMDKEILSWRLTMLIIAIISGCILFAKHDAEAINTVATSGGGALGAFLALGLEKTIKSVPIIMAFSSIIFLTAISLLFAIPWLKIMESIGKAISFIFAAIFGLVAKRKLKKTKIDSTPPEFNLSKEKVENNDDLQEKIKLLNAMAEKKQADKQNDPTFTIGRYAPEEDFSEDYQDKLTSNDTDDIEIEQTPAFIGRVPYPEHSQPHTQEIATEQAQNTSKPIPTNNIVPAKPNDSLVSADSKKTEPTLLDFTHAKPIASEIPISQITDEIKDYKQNKPEQQSPHTPPTIPVTPIEESKKPIAPSFSVLEENIDEYNHSETQNSVVEPIEPSPELTQAFLKSDEPINPKSTSIEWDTVSEPTQPVATPQNTQINHESSPEAEAQLADKMVENQTPTPVSAPTPELVPTQADVAITNKVSIGKAYDTEAQINQPIKKHHELPGINLLDTPPPQENAYTEDVLADMASVLERTLKQFNVDATVMHVSPGPVITRFEIDLAPGIQAKKITGLSVDLARALAVSGVRVEEVIPGSSYVGLEVPNKQRQIVYFKDIVRSKAFQKSKSPLTLSLGSDTSGKPVVADLMKMPHALVAGTTGSGKSVCINVMLLSMLYKASPKDLRLILVDPKMLEMSMYEDIPHLLTPVITDMNEAENALTWAVAEMERRYKLMSVLKVRKIDAFNEAVEAAIKRGEPIKDPIWEPNESVGYTHHPTLERLPFIVIVIDELADMMMVVGKQVEQLIARLTQKARAAGIHVLLATQRPSTDVLTGLIKANVPTRIAFQVSSGTDSRVIIDSVGAEKLLGHGDMLYVPPGAGHPQRLHGAFVDDAETDRITNFLRSMGEPDYINGITAKQNPEDLGAFGAAEAGEPKEDADPLYGEAIQIVISTGKASISSVQRQLRIGYNRAARMIEDMQEQGIVSAPVNGIRKVIAAPKDNS